MIRRPIVNKLKEQLILATKSLSLEEIYKKLRKNARVRVKMRNCHYRELFSVNKVIIKHWTRWLNLTSVPGLYSELDLVKGTYEGGFKVWESTKDLIKYLSTSETEMMCQLLYSPGTLRVLEIGAGSALPTMTLLNRICGDPAFNKPYEFHLQDFNWEVLASLSLINFAANFPIDFLEALIDKQCLRFFHGDWKNFKSDSRYNLIMMSEVIYNADNYESLHSLFIEHLDFDGYIVLATKNTYFGLSGDLYSWIQFVNSKKVFYQQQQIVITTSNIPRSIIIMRYHPLYT